MKQILTLLFLFSIFSVSAFTQKKETRSSDVRIIKDKPGVYISFERVGKREPIHIGESNNGIWLRFYNNSKWEVGTCIWDIANRKGEKDFVYEVERYEDTDNSEEIPIGHTSKHGCPKVFIAPGKSALFSVLTVHLADGLAIKVQFHYEWEVEPDGYRSSLEPKHYVFFYSRYIPKK